MNNEINDYLLMPLSDKASDILGVERRKYLARHIDLSSLNIKETTSNLVYNNFTLDYFQIDYSSLIKKEIIFNEKIYLIYQGKIKIIKPIPIMEITKKYILNKNRNELYLECFDGDFYFLENLEIINPNNRDINI